MILSKATFTGLLDRNCLPICVDDLIWNGMRRGDKNGWTRERVVRGNRDEPWMLADPETGERGQMQWDQELRDKMRRPT